MRRQLLPSLAMLAAFTVLCGLAYPLVITGVARTAFGAPAAGSLIERDGEVVGSRLIGQPFTDANYFHPRPSAAGDGYDASASSGSNLGPTNDELLDAVAEAVAEYRLTNGLSAAEAVPVDAVTASASGLDPHISVANARLQIRRVAEARGVADAEVATLVERHTQGRSLGFLGEAGVNVLELNLALDRRNPAEASAR
ncbi:MAG: K(+)-transporting ATPase subunit C [Acidimicrobiales bacterium]